MCFQAVDPSRHFCCMRKVSINKLLTDIASSDWPDSSMALIQSPPATGKSSFITLLSCLTLDYHVVRVSLVGFSTTLDEKIAEPPQKMFRLSLSKDPKPPSAAVGVLSSRLLEHVCRNLWFQDGYIREVKTLEDVLDNNNFFPEPRKGLIFIVDEAQKIIGRDFADAFFEKLCKRPKPLGVVPFHKTSLFFSSTSLDIASNLAANQDILSEYSSSSSNWYRKYTGEYMSFSLPETQEFILDVNGNNDRRITITPAVGEIIHRKTNGHIGYITALVKSILENFRGLVFDPACWLLYQTTSSREYEGALLSVRCSTYLKAIFERKETPLSKACDELLEHRSVAKANVDAFCRLIKLGIASTDDDNKVIFSSCVVESLAIRMKVCCRTSGNLLLSVPRTVLDYLTICLPLLNSRVIQESTSTMARGGVQTQKEAVWVDHLFAAAHFMLPRGFVTEPQQRAGSGQVDIYVHNGVSYYMEFCVTEFSDKSETIPQTMVSEIDRHTTRFTPHGTYSSLQNIECAVVNITKHYPPPVNIVLPDKFFATLYHYVVNDLSNPKLVWKEGSVVHEIGLPFGMPMRYNPATKILIQHPDDAVRKFQQLLG